MNARHISILVIFLLSGPCMMRQFGVSVGLTESADNQSLVFISVQNGLGNDVRNARAWVFWFDTNGKVFGQQSKWLGGACQDYDGEEENLSAQVLIADGAETSFPMSVKNAPVDCGLKCTISGMSNILKMELQQSSKALTAKGWKHRRPAPRAGILEPPAA